MWKNFQEVLEKRVKNKNLKKTSRDVDDFMLLKISKKVLGEAFGKIGIENIEISLAKETKNLIIKCKKSTWRSEIKLKQNELRSKINKKYGMEAIKRVVIWS